MKWCPYTDFDEDWKEGPNDEMIFINEIDINDNFCLGEYMGKNGYLSNIRSYDHNFII